LSRKGTNVYSVSAHDLAAPFQIGDTVTVPFTATSNEPSLANVLFTFVEVDANRHVRKMVQVMTDAGMDIFEMEAVKPLPRINSH